MLSDFSEFFFQWDWLVGGLGCYLSYESCGEKGLLATGKDLWISNGAAGHAGGIQLGHRSAVRKTVLWPPSCFCHLWFLPPAPGFTFLPAVLRDMCLPWTPAWGLELTLLSGLPSGNSPKVPHRFPPSTCLAWLPPQSIISDCLSPASYWHLWCGLCHYSDWQVLDHPWISLPSIGCRYLGFSDCLLI